MSTDAGKTEFTAKHHRCEPHGHFYGFDHFPGAAGLVTNRLMADRNALRIELARVEARRDELLVMNSEMHLIRVQLAEANIALKAELAKKPTIQGNLRAQRRKDRVDNDRGRRKNTG